MGKWWDSEIPLLAQRVREKWGTQLLLIGKSLGGRGDGVGQRNS